MMGMRVRFALWLVAVSAANFFAVPYCSAEKAKIFVIRESDGSIRFTNREPARGVKADVFTSDGRGVSWYRGAGIRRDFHQIYPEKFDAIIAQAARQHQVLPALVKAVIHAESAFNPRAISPKGARGLMQLMPGTARDLGVRNPFNPESNIWGGTKYLAQLLRRYEGKVEFALAAYNAGPEPVERFNGIPPYAETQEYVRRVLNLKKRYSAVSHG